MVILHVIYHKINAANYRLTRRQTYFSVAVVILGICFRPQPAAAQSVDSSASQQIAAESLPDRMQRISRENADSQDKTNKVRDARTNRITSSICVGCSGPVVPLKLGDGLAGKKGSAKHRAVKPTPDDPTEANNVSRD